MIDADISMTAMKQCVRRYPLDRTDAVCHEQ